MKCQQWALCVCISMFPVVAQCGTDDLSEDWGMGHPPTIVLAAVKITHKQVEVRCEITNQGVEDIWVFGEDLGRRDSNSARGTNARFFINPDGAAFMILRRMNTPRGGVMGQRVGASYHRLRPGESLPQVFLITLPVATATDRALENTLSAMTVRCADTLTRLIFEIGYYSSQDLRSMENPGGYQYVQFDASSDQVILRDYVEMGIWNRERALVMAVDGVSVPLTQWLKHKEEVEPKVPVGMLTELFKIFFENRETLPASEYRYAETLFSFESSLFDDTAHRVADVFIQLAQGSVAPSEFVNRLDEIADRSGRDRLLDDLYKRQLLMSSPDAPRLTQLQLLQDLFYAFCLSPEEYRDGRQLLSFDESLFDDAARQVASVYQDVANGKVAPSELTPRLDKILDKDARARLITALRAKEGGEAGSH